MRHIPRWATLKHFNNVMTVDYADGQAFLDILKVKLNSYNLHLWFCWCSMCLIPCAVHHSMHCSDNAQKLCSCSLYTCLCTLPNNDRSSLHDRGPAGSTKGVYFKLQRYLFGKHLVIVKCTICWCTCSKWHKCTIKISSSISSMPPAMSFRILNKKVQWTTSTHVQVKDFFRRSKRHTTK